MLGFSCTILITWEGIVVYVLYIDGLEYLACSILLIYEQTILASVSKVWSQPCDSFVP